MGSIFISYRREDTAGHAGRIFDRLAEKFGRDKVFIDVSAIEPGLDFKEAIDRAVGSCDALLVIIGKKWLTCTDASGKRRLDDPIDFIRLETATALRRDIRVVPVLVQDAAMPGEGDLPDDLKKLARRQAAEISDTHWNSDTAQLIEILEKVLPREQKMATQQARDAAQIAVQTEEKRESSSSIFSGMSKHRLAWIMSSIVALVVGMLYFGLGTHNPPQNVAPVAANPPKKVVVPDLSGIYRADALVRLRQGRLLPGTIKNIADDRPTGTVIQQDPAPGSLVLPGSAVNLVLAEKRSDSLAVQILPIAPMLPPLKSRQ